MASGNGNGGAATGGSAAFNEFVSQFNARLELQYFPPNNGQQQQQLQGVNPSAAGPFSPYVIASNLTPTAAEFVPRKYQQTTTATPPQPASMEAYVLAATPSVFNNVCEPPTASAEDDRDDREVGSRAGSSAHHHHGSGRTGFGVGGSGRPRRNESLKPRNGWHTRDDRPVGRGNKWKSNQATTAGTGGRHQRLHDGAFDQQYDGDTGVGNDDDGDDFEDADSNEGQRPLTNEDGSSSRYGPRDRLRGNQRAKHHHNQDRNTPVSRSTSSTAYGAGPPQTPGGAGAAVATTENPFKPLSKCSQREKLMREIECYRLECLVCCEIVKPMQSTWSCGNCYHILHLGCVTRWATSSQSDDGSWRCPACQNVLKAVPREYFCFCGKQKNPAYNRNDLAHTCGEVCGRRDLCEHACTLLCHPGPCPPCQAFVQRRCGCGRLEKPLQCSQKEELLCGATCDRALNCDRHRCAKRCHAAECDPCEEQVQHNCFCGKCDQLVPCTRANLEKTRYSCGAVCDHPLSCGNHRCPRLCHEGECEPCADSPDIVRHCPCGRQPIEPGSRTSCLDPIAVCTAACGKKLTCGPPGAHHCCDARCHRGECPPCKKSTTVKCRCGNMSQPMKCKDLTTRADDARCKKRCVRRRSCAKHKCNQLCCIDIDHVCPKTCSLPLGCGRHRCDKPCHKGNCRPCHRVSFDELTCDCGANIVYPPVPCGTKKPACDRPCPRQHGCDHPALHNCHAEPDCPPCVVLTAKHCFGRHEQRKTIPCYQASFSCGMPCARPLPCGRHRCIRACHEDACNSPEGGAVDAVVCKQSCTATRESCGHLCNAPCHEGDCPDVPCRVTVEVTCECGNRKQQRTCHDFSKEYRRIASTQLASSVQEMQRGGSVELSDILGPLRPKNNKTLECNEECRLLERNRRLAIALQIRNPDLPSKLQPNYSEFLRTYAKKDLALVQMVHDKLTELVKLAKESKQKSRSYSFPVMNREKRTVVKEMCNMFGVEAVAYDAEPNRNVVATADRFTSWLPSMSLMEVLQRENGQRRIVVPNLNAWGRTSGASASGSK